MMRRILTKAVLAMVAGGSALAMATAAEAQEIQLTGPLAGAPAGRHLRLHRQGRFEVAPGASFSLLDEYQRTIMPGAKLTYHFTDWFGVGVFGGYGLQYTTSLTDELQEKAVDARRCDINSASKACTLTAVNLTRAGTNSDGSAREGTLAADQMGQMTWLVAPQLTFVPFRGKLAFLASLFVDTDVNLFIGPAFIGVNERKQCGVDDDGGPLDPCNNLFVKESRVAVAPTFGLGLNFYPSEFLGFGAEWRGLPFSWNTSGFDNHGGGPDESFPDNAVNGADSVFHFNSMITVYATVALPTKIKVSD